MSRRGKIVIQSGRRGGLKASRWQKSPYMRKLLENKAVARVLNRSGERREFFTKLKKASEGGHNAVREKELAGILAEFRGDKTDSLKGREARRLKKALGITRKVRGQHKSYAHDERISGKSASEPQSSEAPQVQDDGQIAQQSLHSLQNLRNISEKNFRVGDVSQSEAFEDQQESAAHNDDNAKIVSLDHVRAQREALSRFRGKESSEHDDHDDSSDQRRVA